MKILLIGIGNLDRQDDGVSWRLLQHLGALAGATLPESPEEGNEFFTPLYDLYFTHQLVPEDADRIIQYDRVIFLDAHTTTIAEPVSVQPVRPALETRLLTHHLSAGMALSLTDSLYQRHPESWLISVKGTSFQFSRELSAETSAYLPLALAEIQRVMSLSHP